MRIAFFTTYYPPFLRSYYSGNALVNEKKFLLQQQDLLNCFFADTGSAFYYSQKTGNESFLIIANDETLQKKWAVENSFAYTEKNWKYEIALAQIKNFKPDVLFIESVFEFYGSFIQSCSSYCRKIVSWISTPMDNTINLSNINLVLSSTPAFVKHFKEMGLKSDYLLPAFDNRVLNHIDNTAQKNIAVSFVGGWSNVHLNRKKALRQLVQKTPLQIWGYGFKNNFSKKSLGFYFSLLSDKNKPVFRKHKGEAWGLAMYQLLHQSLVTFNIHESLLEGYVGNMRMFEATGVGTLLINDSGVNLPEIFEEEKEIISYRNIDEAAEKINYYINHPSEAIAIGLRAQQRTLKDYNYNIYIEKLNLIFKNLL